MFLARASESGLEVRGRGCHSAPWASSLSNDDAWDRRIKPFFSILKPATSEKRHQPCLKSPNGHTPASIEKRPRQAGTPAPGLLSCSICAKGQGAAGDFSRRQSLTFPRTRFKALAAVWDSHRQLEAKRATKCVRRTLLTPHFSSQISLVQIGKLVHAMQNFTQQSPVLTLMLCSSQQRMQILERAWNKSTVPRSIKPRILQQKQC